MKKSLTLSATLLCIAGLFSGSAMAVDGYKNLKFGMSKKEVLASKSCSFEQTPSDRPGVETYVCDNLKFGGQKSPAAAYFINGKFYRIAIIQPIDSATIILKQLLQKYGDPIQRPDDQLLQDIYNKPNIQADIIFDNRTVALRLTSDANYNKQALVIYTSLDYEDLLTKSQQESMSNDL